MSDDPKLASLIEIMSARAWMLPESGFERKVAGACAAILRCEDLRSRTLSDLREAVTMWSDRVAEGAQVREPPGPHSIRRLLKIIDERRTPDTPDDSWERAGVSSDGVTQWRRPDTHPMFVPLHVAFGQWVQQRPTARRDQPGYQSWAEARDGWLHWIPASNADCVKLEDSGVDLAEWVRALNAGEDPPVPPRPLEAAPW